MDCNSPTYRFSCPSTPEPLREARMVSTLMRQRSLAHRVAGAVVKTANKTATISKPGNLNRIVFTFHVRIFVVPEDGLSRFGGFKNHNR